MADALRIHMLENDLWPREPVFRYRLYRRDGDHLEVLAAAPELGGVGCALAAHLEEEGPVVGTIGVLDTHPYDRSGTWLVSPFPVRS